MKFIFIGLRSGCLAALKCNYINDQFVSLKLIFFLEKPLQSVHISHYLRSFVIVKLFLIGHTHLWRSQFPTLLSKALNMWMANPVACDFSLPYFISRLRVFHLHTNQNCSELDGSHMSYEGALTSAFIFASFHHNTSLAFTYFPPRTQFWNEFPLEWTISFFALIGKKRFLCIQHKYSICSIKLNAIKYFSSKAFFRWFDVDDLFAVVFFTNLGKNQFMKLISLGRLGLRVRQQPPFETKHSSEREDDACFWNYSFDYHVTQASSRLTAAFMLISVREMTMILLSVLAQIFIEAITLRCNQKGII